jgi:Ca2+-binding RTX toxin-like protein
MLRVFVALLAWAGCLLAAEGAQAVNVVGGPRDDVLVGTLFSDRLDALAGDDVIYGLGGADVISAGAGDDGVVGDGDCPSDSIVSSIYCSPGEGAGDELAGGPGRDVLDGGVGADTLVGEADGDDLAGGPGDDVLDGGGGWDQLSGGADADRLDGGAGSDVVDGGAGADRLTGGMGSDLVFGGPGNDTIMERDGYRDTVTCGGGRDRVAADSSDHVASSCETVVRPGGTSDGRRKRPRGSA